VRGILRRSQRLALAILVAALLLGLYNDFAIRWRVADSLAGTLPSQSGLSVERCSRLTSLALQGKNFFACPVSRTGRGTVVYHLKIKGRCWIARPAGAPPRSVPRKLRACLSPFHLGVR
jgi:hypothetical protein